MRSKRTYWIINIHLLLGLVIILTALNGYVYAQETNTNVTGIVKSEDGEVLEGATVSVVHVPTRSVYNTKTNSKGYFHFFHLKPGGPYLVSVSFVGFRALDQGELYTQFGSNSFHSPGKEHTVFNLQPLVTEMAAVAIRKTAASGNQLGTETITTPFLLKDMPSVSRNIQDYARLVPQAKVYADGGMSFAGQNNKFNAFYIDGANAMDLLGVSSSGISGGQTSSPPVSIDALEEIRILISPYDVQYGNFTGASINAVTRSGTNDLKGSAWYYFRNEDMVGRSPEKDPVSGSRTKLPPFFANTLGSWISGPLVKDKVFYFASIEWQKEEQPQPFDLSSYKGSSSKQEFQALRDTLGSRYGYDPGAFDLTFNNLNALRYIAKIDWNTSARHKLSFTYRLNKAERQTPAQPNGGNMVRFLNNGFKIFTNTNFATFEWRSFFNSRFSNKFLMSYSSQKDDRQILGDPFPGVTILDDPGTIVFGPNAASQVSLFKGRDLSIVDVFKWVQGNHVWSTGIDFGFSWLNDMILASYFGSYVFGNLNDFLLNGYPVLYQRTLMRSEQAVHEKSVGSSAKFMTSRLGFFLQDEWKITPELQLKYGVRIDGNSWNTAYPADEYFNKTGVPAISAYYDLRGARSGQVLNTHWQLQPRVELISRLPDENVVLKFGAGVFTGHILNIWATDIYNYKTASLEVTPSAYNLGFNPDVNAQPGFSSLGLDPARNKGNVVLITPDFKYPTGIRMSSSVWKMLGKGWNVGLELLLTRNLHEISYTNVNLLPPTLTSAGVGPRTVYAASGQAPRVPMDGGNPYNNILLMANNNDRKGNSYSMTASLNSPTDHNSFFSASYTYGHSKALFEPTGTSGPNLLQWRSLETIHGRNNSMITTSDFDMMHRICIYGMRKFNYAKGRASTTFSFFYQGQSGQPYSYVYGRSMVNDFGPNASIDLIYFPTTSELQDMIFIPITGPNGNFTPDQQKAMLDEFIESDRYLRKIRGSFSERNKARLPFTHTVDIRIQQEFNIKAGSKNLRFGIVLDVFNVLNLLNSEWGRTYQIIGDNISLVKFEKYISATRLIPQYQFSFTGKPWSVQSSTAPGSSARWISQLGFRFYL